MEISQNFVAFSEYMKFKLQIILMKQQFFGHYWTIQISVQCTVMWKVKEDIHYGVGIVMKRDPCLMDFNPNFHHHFTVAIFFWKRLFFSAERNKCYVARISSSCEKYCFWKLFFEIQTSTFTMAVFFLKKTD